MGKPENGTRLEPAMLCENHEPDGRGDSGTDRNATCPRGVLSGILLGGRESRPRGKGPDGSTLNSRDSQRRTGILDTDGKVIDPDAGTQQGGIVSPIPANVYLRYALDLWFEKAVKKHSRGKAFICRFADDFVYAFQLKDDAERFYRTLPKRLAKYGLEVAPEKTQILRFSRFHPSMERGFTFLGFEFYWFFDHKGEKRVMRRTARKKLKPHVRDCAGDFW